MKKVMSKKCQEIGLGKDIQYKEQEHLIMHNYLINNSNLKGQFRLKRHQINLQ